jgi:hypothetical protein
MVVFHLVAGQNGRLARPRHRRDGGPFVPLHQVARLGEPKPERVAIAPREARVDRDYVARPVHLGDVGAIDGERCVGILSGHEQDLGADEENLALGGAEALGELGAVDDRDEQG